MISGRFSVPTRPAYHARGRVKRLLNRSDDESIDFELPVFLSVSILF